MKITSHTLSKYYHIFRRVSILYCIKLLPVTANPHHFTCMMVNHNDDSNFSDRDDQTIAQIEKSEGQPRSKCGKISNHARNAIRHQRTCVQPNIACKTCGRKFNYPEYMRSPKKNADAAIHVRRRLPTPNAWQNTNAGNRQLNGSGPHPRWVQDDLSSVGSVTSDSRHEVKYTGIEWQLTVNRKCL